MSAVFHHYRFFDTRCTKPTKNVINNFTEACFSFQAYSHFCSNRVSRLQCRPLTHWNCSSNNNNNNIPQTFWTVVHSSSPTHFQQHMLFLLLSHNTTSVELELEWDSSTTMLPVQRSGWRIYDDVVVQRPGEKKMKILLRGRISTAHFAWQMRRTSMSEACGIFIFIVFAV